MEREQLAGPLSAESGIRLHRRLDQPDERTLAALVTIGSGPTDSMVVGYGGALGQCR